MPENWRCEFDISCIGVDMAALKIRRWLLVVLSMVLWIAIVDANAETRNWGVHITNFTGSVDRRANANLRNLSYSIRVLSGPEIRNIYYSQYVFFAKKTARREAYYTGIQPQGGGVALVIFSYFGAGGRVVDSNLCKAGADGGVGVTCNRLKIPFRLGALYKFNISLVGENDDENIWEGSVVDVSSGVVNKIGSWATPKAIGHLSGESIGFVEDYIGISSCAEIPATIVYFGPGVSISENGSYISGSVNAPYAVGVCKGKIAFSSVPDADGGQTIYQRAGTK
ncbi:hypothetical protein ACS0Y3_31580 [Burkholderia gladioli]|uniref:hypothetical protein n=1 Tax=Burkholderia gladioli TaxID=28095 RepID=UPI003F78EA3E